MPMSIKLRIGDKSTRRAVSKPQIARRIVQCFGPARHEQTTVYRNMIDFVKYQHSFFAAIKARSLNFFVEIKLYFVLFFYLNIILRHVIFPL